VLVKIAAVVLVLAIVPAALWVAGGLPLPHARQDLVSVLPEPKRSPEAAWRQRVGSICGWQRKQVRTLGKAFRRAATPADVQLLLESAIRLGERSTEIFRRLDAPLTYRREARTLLLLWHRENDALKEFAAAAERQNRAAFAYRMRVIARLDFRISRIFARLDVDGCTRKPVRVLDEDRAPIV
jgi:hypothetical protein